MGGGWEGGNTPDEGWVHGVRWRQASMCCSPAPAGVWVASQSIYGVFREKGIELTLVEHHVNPEGRGGGGGGGRKVESGER